MQTLAIINVIKLIKKVLPTYIALLAVTSCIEVEFSPRIITFDVQNRSTFTVNEVELNLKSTSKQQTFSRIEGLAPNQQQTVKLNLKDYPNFRRGEASYEAVVRADAGEITKVFGYIKNGYDSDKPLCIVEITDSLINIK